MNIEKANAVPLAEVLEIMGQKPKKKTAKSIKYLSPYRVEKTASFFVFNDNKWWDYGTGEGGDVVALVRKYLECQKVGSSVSDALRWIKNMTRGSIVAFPANNLHAKKDEREKHSIVFKLEKPIKQTGLIRYGEKRGLSEAVLRKYLKEVHFENVETGKTIFALGMKNESGGYEVRNSFFKGCVKAKNVTLIRGLPKPPGVHVFEGMMDFLTVIEWRKGQPLDDDAIILHSLNCMNKGSAFIRNYGYQFCYTWMDNDAAGDRATHIWAEFCREEAGLTHVPMNKAYLPHKDVNAAHMAKLGL